MASAWSGWARHEWPLGQICAHRPELPGDRSVKIQLLSDLHLERNIDFVPEVAPGAQVLVLAGDVGSYQSGSRLPDADFGLRMFSPKLHPERWPQVLYVPGNHEYDALEYEPTHVRLRETCERLGITWLEREIKVIGGVRFVGTTLWSDFDALVPPEAAMTQRLQQREKAFRAANFYLRKYSTLRGGEAVLAEGLRELALQCQAWLREALVAPYAGPTVVVTHFAPSLRSADPRYGLVPGTAGFCNALEDLMPGAQWWLHGHLHCRANYSVEGVVDGRLWRCRVMANPLGYAHKGEQVGFVPDLAIDLTT